MSCDHPQVEDGDIALTSLDRPDEGPVQIALLAQLRLGQAKLFSVMP